MFLIYGVLFSIHNFQISIHRLSVISYPPMSRIFAFLTLIALTGACSFVGIKKQNGSPLTKKLSSADGKCAVKLPASWYAKNKLNEQAGLQAADIAANSYVIVISESKKNFKADETLEDYTDSIIEKAPDQVTGFKNSSVKSFKLGDYEAQQFEVTGTVEKTRLKWLLTTIDAPKNYHQIMVWTTEAKYEANKKLFEQIVESFEETEGKAPKEE